MIAAALCVLAASVVFLYTGRAGGEIGFTARIDAVQGNTVYATVTQQHTGFLSRKLPENIIFDISDFEEVLKAGDTIHGCYLRGTIDGPRVRVVSIAVKPSTE